MVAEIIDPKNGKGYLAGTQPVYIEILKDFNVNESILADFPLGNFGVYNLGNHWELELHIWRLRALGMLFKTQRTNF